MAGCCSAIIYPLIRKLGRRDGGEPSPCESVGLDSNRRHSPIRILNDDVLLNIFHLYRLAYTDDTQRLATGLHWPRQNWWYKLAHVCRLWRNIILESPSGLNLHLFCTNGVPVADMLAHSPPLPLIIAYHNDLDRPRITAEDESGMLLALSHRDRVRHISFWELLNPDKFVAAMDDRFPILERMHIKTLPLSTVALPMTFQAPNLRHLKMWMASTQIRSPVLTNIAGLVTLELLDIPIAAYFPPSYMLTLISVMAQLERLSIGFRDLLQYSDAEGESLQTPDAITLANLQRFEFRGVSAYLESLIARIGAPSLNSLQVYFHNQPSFTVPRLLGFMQACKNLTFSSVQVAFDAYSVSLYAVPWSSGNPLLLKIWSGHIAPQITSAAQLLGSLSPILSVVEKVTISSRLKYSSEWYINGDHLQWRALLRPFTNAKVIHVQGHLVGQIFHSLLSDDGGPPLGLLPNLEEVEYSGGSDFRDEFTAFLNERQVAGHPVSLRLVDPSIFDEHRVSRVLQDWRVEF